MAEWMALFSNVFVNYVKLHKVSKGHVGDFSGGPVAKTPRSQSRGSEFDPWLGN